MRVFMVASLLTSSGYRRDPGRLEEASGLQLGWLPRDNSSPSSLPGEGPTRLSTPGRRKEVTTARLLERACLIGRLTLGKATQSAPRSSIQAQSTRERPGEGPDLRLCRRLENTDGGCLHWPANRRSAPPPGPASEIRRRPAASGRMAVTSASGSRRSCRGAPPASPRRRARDCGVAQGNQVVRGLGQEIAVAGLGQLSLARVSSGARPRGALEDSLPRASARLMPRQ